MGVMADIPSWVRNVESTQSLFAMIHKKREDLSKQMGKSKRIGFDEEGEKQRRQQISALSDEISDLFKQCERNIQVEPTCDAFLRAYRFERLNQYVALLPGCDERNGSERQTRLCHSEERSGSFGYTAP
jgi:hypothetical protein